MDWFLTSGIRVIIIVAIGAAVYFICRPIIRSVIKRIICRQMAGEDETEVQQRTDTLSSVLVKIAGILILVVAVITILP